VQVWATWFPREGRPQTWIQGFPLKELYLSPRGVSPLLFEAGENRITENECNGNLNVEGHRIRWDLRYRSSFRTELSSKGWIGFSRTPHSDAVFSGEIFLNDQSFRGDPLAHGMQGHNCGYRHRKFWTWTHLHFQRKGAAALTFEALVYEMPLGMIFRRAVLWHEGEKYVFSRLRERARDMEKLTWSLECRAGESAFVDVEIRGRQAIHHLPYFKTDCSEQFEVANESLATRLMLRLAGKPAEILGTHTGAVLEMTGRYI